MSKKRTDVRVTKEGRDYEREAEKRPITDRQVRENVPQPWKGYAKNAQRQISVPIPGSSQTT